MKDMIDPEIIPCSLFRNLRKIIFLSVDWQMQALFQIGRGEPPPVPDSLSTDARDFIFKCLQVNPNKRPTAAQLLNHPFVKRPPQTSSVPASPRATAYVREFFGQPSVL